MAQKKRVFQIAERIKEVLASQLQRVSDSRLRMVTITAVVTSPDLRHAKVYWITSGDADRLQEVADGFDAAKKHLRHLVGQALGIKFTPELAFYYDDTLDETAKVEDLFRRIDAEKKLRGN